MSCEQKNYIACLVSVFRARPADNSGCGSSTCGSSRKINVGKLGGLDEIRRAIIKLRLTPWQSQCGAVHDSSLARIFVTTDPTLQIPRRRGSKPGWGMPLELCYLDLSESFGTVNYCLTPLNLPASDKGGRLLKWVDQLIKGRTFTSGLERLIRTKG